MNIYIYESYKDSLDPYIKNKDNNKDNKNNNINSVGMFTCTQIIHS